MSLPLQGVRVLDLSQVWSGPLAGRILADLGAEVIHIGSRRRIPLTQISPEVAAILGMFPDNDPGENPWNRSSMINDFARNKLGMTLEMNTDEGLEIFKCLVRVSDIVLENYSPRVMPNFGLDYPDLKKINAGIIMCQMPGYGLTGPYREYVSYGTNLDPSSGLASLMGYPGEIAHMSGNAYPDPVAGLHAVAAILTALFYRRRTGKGQRIDLSQAESATCVIGEAILGYSLNKQIPQNRANRHPEHAPHGCFPCKGEDKWVMISVTTEEEWSAFCRAIGAPALATDSKYSTRRLRVENQDELGEWVRSWTLQYTHYEAMERLQRVGVSAGAVLNARELATNPHLLDRGFFWEIHHPEAGRHQYCGLPIRLSNASPSPRRPAPCLGEHNKLILSGILGLSDEEINDLENKGIIGTEPLTR
jgi:crotonobetainyl-CoA:carnitine CoA-transferase CaiB-like acyl-CoA transferase